MAQEKKLQAAGAFADLRGAVANAYGDITADHAAVLLTEASSLTGAGYCPVAATPLQDLPEDLPKHPWCGSSPATYCSDGNLTSAYALQVVVDAAVGAKAGNPMPLGAARLAGADAGNDGGRRGNLSAIVGVFAASSAVTAVSAGALSPPVAFGFFLVLLGGVALTMASVRAP